MTHARKNASIGQYRVEGRGHVERWSHGETVGGAWPVHSLREGKAKKDMAKKVKTNGRESQCLAKHSMKMNETKTKKGKCNTTSERHRKLYPLRGRSEAKSCHVLLTRLDDETKVCEVDPDRVSGHKKKPKPYKKAENSRESLQERLKTKPEATIDKPSAQEPRKRRLASLNAEALNSLLLEKTDGPPGAKLARKQGGGSSTTEQTKTGSKRAVKTCQKPKRMKKALTDKTPDALSLYAPTPRRLAGLNAAALLKLTSSTAANKHRIKTDRKTVCKPQAQKSGKHSWTQPELEGACEVCKSRSFESKPTPESHRLAEAGYQSMLGYRPVKLVKEEPVEAELSPYFCCPPEGSVGYCHRLALFLGRQAYGEGEEQPVVKHECLVPAHPALTLSAHPCLCVDPCCSSYYVHIAHPGTASLSARMLPCTHSGSQLLASSGVPHPAFCGSVGSPCCAKACRVSGYAFSAVQSRTCSFSTNCSSCSHPIKTEEEHSRTLLVPPDLPRSGCPGMPRVTPRLLSTTSEAEVRLKVGKECPQNTKPSNGSLTMGHSRSSLKHPTASAKHQKKASHRQATNGWRPVGVPTEKEVFIAGDDETVLRQSYEGVERDGEVIRVRDTVLVRSGPRKKSLPYVAKISALWEDPRTGELMMSLFWYYRPEHTQGGRDPSMHCENEIFASRHQDENSVACIEERCYVLPLAQYCRFCALVKRRSEGMSDHAPLVPRPSDSTGPAPHPVPRSSDSTGPAYRLVPRPSDSTGPAPRMVPRPSDSTGPAHRPVPHLSDGTGPAHRPVPDGIDPQLVYLCRHVYDFRYGRILKNLQ
ncbi:bromo adjacent homology domain-containing 1 protein-like [Sinocyclocheilus grahami]|uniref:bromo adjacent homology domain-containing 1 protein-like n=1 Tax=Sinocyclocheilus grahami TaxID=75366 RepID=UPI0007AC9180|nr:PREDICTED: bromo adjacent homology domain-containing 1 protein-like [Sinocyclocheilus grahami]